MSQSQTSGYDILVQLSEQELNAQIEALNLLYVFGPAQLTFHHLELDQPSSPAIYNGVRMFFNATVGTCSYLIWFNAILDLFPLIGNPRKLAIYTDEHPLLPNLNVPKLDGQLDPAGQPSCPAFSVIQGLLTGALNGESPIEFGDPIDLPPSSDPLTPTDLHIKVIDAPTNGIDCVTFMLNTGGTTGGTPAGVTTYLGTGSTGAVVTLSNQLVLERLIRPRLASALGASFNPPCVLASPVLIFDQAASRKILGIKYSIHVTIYLETMSVVIEGNHLRVIGTVGGSGTGFSCTGSFDVLLYIELGSNGLLNVRQDAVQLNAVVSFEWWVWAVAALTGGSLALLLTAAIQAAIGPVIAGLLTEFAAFASRLGYGGIAVPSIPLGPAGGQLQIQSVLLDDLTLAGPVTRVPAVAAGLAIQGDLHVSHTDTTTTVNGVLVTGLLNWQPGNHVVSTRKFAYRGLFSAALSQPVIPATFLWTWGGAPINGTGTRVVSQAGTGGIRLDVTIYFQVEGAHCWIWTPVGTTLVAQNLSLTLIDGAGHHSTASRVLSCDGIRVTDFIMQAVVANLVFDPAGAPSDAVASAERMIQNLGLIAPAINRTAELSAAFKKGLTAKLDTK